MDTCPECNTKYEKNNNSVEKSFLGGTLVVTDIPSKTCICNRWFSLGDGVIVDGYAALLEKSDVRGRVEVSLHKLKERFTPMDFIQPFLNKGKG